MHEALKQAFTRRDRLRERGRISDHASSVPAIATPFGIKMSPCPNLRHLAVPIPPVSSNV